jgi:predicted nucleic acid-binding protein
MKYGFNITTYSRLLKEHQKSSRNDKKADQIIIPNVVIAELQYGFELGSRKSENEKMLARFIANRKVRVVLPDNSTTIYFVNIAVLARKKGVQLSTHDA